ncbi:MAG: TonB-dependent receptor [Bacteroidales bacterium]|nr:TonB-dependent receptor [Bacteroidales bacterium]
MLCLVAFAQNLKVSGVVTDDFGDPMIGVNVTVKGTTNGTITDYDGNYALQNVKADDVLVFSYIGYLGQQVAVENRSTINCQLMEDQTALEEVIVVGYGTMKKKDLTGSVATVNSEKLTAVPVANAAEALQGKMAGVQITASEGSPDASVSIRVRGGGSITQSNEPLYVVDGFPVDNINDIPSSDIEDITILKDASSTAIYGSRGANGVILVTTKSGKEGKINVAYNAYVSVKKVAKKYDVLSASDYAHWTYEHAALRGDGNVNPSAYTKFFGNWDDIDLYNNVQTIDWQDQTFGRTGHAFNHNISINGGSEKIKYTFSYAMMDDKAIMLGSNYKRDNFNLKVQSKLNKSVTLDLSARYSKTKVRGAGANAVNDAGSTSESRMKYATIYPVIPIAGLTDTDAMDTDPEFNMYNPIDVTRDNDQRQLKKQLNVNGALTWEVIKDLRLKTEIGYDDYNNENDRFYGMTTYWIKNNGYSGAPSPGVILKRGARERLRNTNTVNYDFKKLLPESHSLNILLGEEMLITKSKTMTNTVMGLPTSFTAEEAWKLSALGSASSINNYYNPDDKLLSFFGRLNYNYKGRYLLSGTFRADGSSKFSEGNKWGFFPSAAFAWRLSDEAFMEGTKSWLDDLKVRLSYGTAGNNGIPEGQIVQSYAANNSTWINGVNSYWAPSKVMANPNLKWETTITRNIGIDYSFFNGVVNGTIDAYFNNTKDLLINFPVSGTGYDTQYRNMGETRNKGLEFSINWNPIHEKNYDLSIGGNISMNRGEIYDLGSMEDFGASSGWASTDINNDFWISKGGQVGEIRGYKNAGRYEVSDFEGYDSSAKKWILKNNVPDATAILGTSVRPGSMKIKDINGDGKISDEDNTIIGNTNPDFIGGFNVSARVYGFDFSANFTYSVGNDVYNADKVMFTQTSNRRYYSMVDDMAMGKRWTNLRADGTISNDPSELAQMNAKTTMWSPLTGRYVLTDHYVEDASYLRLSTVTLGYTLPKNLLEKAHISNARVYFTGHNLFCLTGYSGLDPEVSTRTATPLTPNVDYSAYPKSRQFVIGINLNF